MRQYIFAFLALTFGSLFANGSADWALRNDGGPQRVDLDPNQDFRVKGIAGQDIHLGKIPAGPVRRVRVAVMDTGASLDHPLLQGFLARNEVECKAFEEFQACLNDESLSDGKTEKEKKEKKANLRKSCEQKYFTDHDGNGMPLDCHGWSVVGGENSWGIIGRPDFSDSVAHGTHVISLVAKASSAMGGNVEILPVQVIEKAPNQPIRPLSLFASPKESELQAPRRVLGDRLLRGLVYAVNAGAKVINLSLGWAAPVDSEAFRKKVFEAQAAGVLFVAAAGNDSTRALLLPCAYPGVICVGAHGPDGAISHFSNYGSGVDLFAPGLDILGMIPMSFTPVRFAGGSGLDYLSGTSQAAPFVTAVVGEMLARGIPADEIKARLMAGSRPWSETTNLQRFGEQVLKDSPVGKWGSGGLLDVQGALNAKPRPFPVLYEKGKIPARWDGRSRLAIGQFHLQNIWTSVGERDVQIEMHPFRDSEAGKFENVKLVGERKPLWANGETRAVTFNYEIKSRSQQSEPLVEVIVKTPGFERRYLAQLEVYRAVEARDPLADSIWNLDFELNLGESIKGIDENLFPSLTPENVVVGQLDGQKWSLALTQVGRDSVIRLKNKTIIEISDDPMNVRTPRIKKLQISPDGQKGYVFEFLSGSKTTIERMEFFVVNEAGEVVRHFSLNNEKMDLPSTVNWISDGNGIVPIWIGVGREPNKKLTLKDLWTNPNGDEKWEKRIYFIDAKNQLQFKEVPEDYILETTINLPLARLQKNEVRFLVSKSEGTKIKPSHLRRHFVFDLKRITSEIDPIEVPLPSLNIRGYRFAPINNLGSDDQQNRGTYWFAKSKSQEVNLITMDQNLRARNYLIHSRKPFFDAALWVRGAFADGQMEGAFVLTNSDVEYHDLKSGKIWSTSQQRYTFYDSELTTSAFYPITVLDRSLGKKLPGLYTTESSALNLGLRLTVPKFNSNSDQEPHERELYFPVGFRFNSERNCRPLDPVQFLPSGLYAIDYVCEGKFLQRYLLQF